MHCISALKDERLLSSPLQVNLFSQQTLIVKMAFDVEACRANFPALKRDQVYLDNAGGSQTLGSVIDS
jgi:hypothetical protein